MLFPKDTMHTAHMPCCDCKNLMALLAVNQIGKTCKCGWAICFRILIQNHTSIQKMIIIIKSAFIWIQTHDLNIDKSVRWCWCLLSSFPCIWSDSFDACVRLVSQILSPNQYSLSQTEELGKSNLCLLSHGITAVASHFVNALFFRISEMFRRSSPFPFEMGQCTN